VPVRRPTDAPWPSMDAMDIESVFILLFIVAMVVAIAVRH
jgi:hypothetical protein